MPDYKEMYLKMMRAAEKAIQILIDAQRECEEMYLNSSDAVLIPLKNEDEYLQFFYLERHKGRSLQQFCKNSGRGFSTAAVFQYTFSSTVICA